MKTETLEDTSKNKDMTNQTMGYLIMFMLFSAVNLSGFILKEKEIERILDYYQHQLTERNLYCPMWQ